MPVSETSVSPLVWGSSTLYDMTENPEGVAPPARNYGITPCCRPIPGGSFLLLFPPFPDALAGGETPGCRISSRGG